MSHVDDLFSPLHLVIVLVIALLIFGPKRLPELGQGLGKSIREFRNATSGLTGTSEEENARPVAGVPGAPSPLSVMQAQVTSSDASAPAQTGSVQAGPGQTGQGT